VALVKRTVPRYFPAELFDDQRSYAETLGRYVNYTRGGCTDALSWARGRLSLLTVRLLDSVEHGVSTATVRAGGFDGQW
jgi:hypothetical protein